MSGNSANESNAYNWLFLLAELAFTIYAIAKLAHAVAKRYDLAERLAQAAEAHNHFDYENRTARIIAGTLIFITYMLHTKRSDDLASIPEKAIIAVGPHRTTLEAFVVAAHLPKGNPPRFFATDSYNAIPVVKNFLELFGVIFVESNATRNPNGRSANAVALDTAGELIKKNGRVLMFPQGNFAKIGQEPPRVYSGIANLALDNDEPIHIIRTDGFWSLNNWLIPQWIRTNSYYLAFLSAFHLNNVRAVLCARIDFHLQPENQNLSREEKLKEILAQTYAYYRETNELSVEEVRAIQKDIENGRHIPVWEEKLKKDELTKQRQEEAQLELATLYSSGLSEEQDEEQLELATPFSSGLSM